MAKKTGLGRGLDSLISGGVKAVPGKTGESEIKTATAGENTRKTLARNTSTEPTATAVGLFELPIGSISANPHQPRKDFNQQGLQELAESIRSEGLLQPVVVRKVKDAYQLIAGERRWRACRLLNLKKIPARIIEATESSSAVLSLIENLQRENLNPIEESMGFASLMRDFDLTQEQVAERVGRSRAAVANSIRLLQLPREIQAYLVKGLISVGHAKVLLALEGREGQMILARQCIEKGWSVRELEHQLERMKSSRTGVKNPRSSLAAEEQRAIADLQKQLSSNLSTRVLVKHTPKKGKIIIEYYGNDDLQRLIEKFGLH